MSIGCRTDFSQSKFIVDSLADRSVSGIHFQHHLAVANWGKITAAALSENGARCRMPSNWAERIGPIEGPTQAVPEDSDLGGQQCSQNGQSQQERLANKFMEGKLTVVDVMRNNVL